MVRSRKFLFLSVFLSGMTTLAVEFTASRMLQAIFGTSNIVWANVIGLVMFFLTVGYFLGGKIADKYPRPTIFYGFITAAGFSSVFFLLLTSVILRQTTVTLAGFNASAVLGSFLGVSMAIAVPITLLGCISPFAIRLGVENVEEAGRISGRIYAVSTWGSLLGTYLPVLYVIPTAGSRMTAVIFGSVLVLTGLIGIWQEADSLRQKTVPTIASILLLPFIFLWTQGHIKENKAQIFETESPYNYVEVLKSNDCYYLYLNEGAAVHSIYCEDGSFPRRDSAFTAMATAPLFTNPDVLENKSKQRAAVIGLGAGTIPKLFMKAYGNMSFDGIEIDPVIVDVGRHYFDMNESNLTVHVGDGRYELNRLSGTYDIITLDAYKPPYIPWHMTTLEFFQEIRDRLDTNGCLAINAFEPGNDARLVNALAATLSHVFPSIYKIEARGFNAVLIATASPTTIDNVKTNYDRLGASGNIVLSEGYRMIQRGLEPYELSETIFTDEIAPVEPMIDSMLFRMLLKRGRS